MAKMIENSDLIFEKVLKKQDEWLGKNILHFYCMIVLLYLIIIQIL